MGRFIWSAGDYFWREGLFFGEGVAFVICFAPRDETFDEVFANGSFVFFRHVWSVEEGIVFFVFGIMPFWVVEDFACVVVWVFGGVCEVEVPKFFALEVESIEGGFFACA